MKYAKFLFLAALFVFLISGLGFAQDNSVAQDNSTMASSTDDITATADTSVPVDEQSATSAAPAETIVTEPAKTEAPAEGETQWIWGEVTAVDAANNEISIKYLDYETDTEKEAKIVVSDTTKLENVQSVGDIKARDTVSVDYTNGPDGKYIAKNVSVEKTEETQAQGMTTAAPVATTTTP